MPDIIVRIPAGQVSHFYGDKVHAPQAFWRFSNRPQRLDERDGYIWFTRPEGVVAGAKVLGVVREVEDTDDPTGKFNVLWDGLDLTLLEAPVPDIQYAGRGFRYVTADEQARLRGVAKTSEPD